MKASTDSAKRIVLLGGGGHGKVVRSLALAAGRQLAGICDPALASQGVARWCDLPVLGGDEALDTLTPDAVELANGVGQLVGSTVRQALFVRLRARGFRFASLVHPAAWVDPTAQLDEGVQVMAGAVVQADCRIGMNTIVNTRAGIDHDDVLGAHVHVAPGATLCGGVHVGDGAFIGAGATVVPGLKVGRAAFVAAGALLARNLADGGRWPQRQTPSSSERQQEVSK